MSDDAIATLGVRSSRRRRELEKAVDAILAGIPPLKLKDQIETLQSRKAGLTALLADVPEDVPNLLPSAAAVYACA
ncbi:hypothetical protein [Chelativorans sp. AA-79]|uniref:hypothetical protein n=1 Tax=Chelativorans sp. AA-79 TaxID=3028735 RepID=UPI0023F8085E|nr:hypothetical protein [Chelativorans sp. AA-79]WEX12083.1 hypothetical protein PVE73_26645 [Chelativorans sp. AA-79]